jgi:Bacterial toxin 44
LSAVKRESDGRLVQRYERSYYQYNWHGDVAAVVDENGNGGGGWNQYGAWGELFGAFETQYYNWNGAWGYMRFPTPFNIDRNDVLDRGLYYVHGRWYNQDTGLYLSPDANGSYLYFEDDPVNKHADPSLAGNQLPPECLGGLTSPLGSNDYNPRDLTCWLYREMKHNLDDPRLQHVRELNQTAEVTLGGGSLVTALDPIPFGAGLTGIGVGAMARGMSEFYDLVADHHVWDFKPKIQDRLGLGITLCSDVDCCLNIEFSVPGNIHYGFVAGEAGYSELTTQAGAGVAEFFDPNHRRDPGDPRYTPYRGAIQLYGLVPFNPPFSTNLGDDPQDNAAVEFGYGLYEKYANGRSLTYTAFQQELGTAFIGFATHAPYPFPVAQLYAQYWPYPLGFFNGTQP